MSYVVSPDCVACDVDGGLAILNLKTNLYFGLDEVGAEVWGLLKEPTSVPELAQSIASNFEVSQAECENDISRLLDEMAQNGLVVRA
ncbi:PqqD family protein [Falsirhodobacter sp. 20TX0035]|uniref:PqqD family protein n=1 Tax=Falsirhodobacter sp. 20TX0035 TaxID=3022019 RepID=UPI0023306D21|nr:PqqD family protein [Falsirhodobacter sp. 20TX0035]MDB6454802.1 PqqD family protein [Falsirhodobacter sp. 20TX0035]